MAENEENTERVMETIENGVTDNLAGMMAGFVKTMPHLAEQFPELKELQVTPKKEDPNEKETKPEEKAELSNKSEEGNPEEGNEEEEQEVEIPGSFFAKKKAKVGDFKTSEEVNAFLAKTYQVKDVKDFGKFLSNVEQWRNSSQKVEEIQEKFDSLTNGLNMLPMEIQSAILAWNKGDDYKTVFNRYASNIDFTKDISAHDKKELVRHFYPDQFDKEDLEDFDDNPHIKAAYDMVKKTLYPQAQQAIARQRADIEAEAETLKRVVASSAKGSVVHLQESFPSIDDKELRKIEKMLSGDDSVLLGLFKNRDGSYKKEAALTLAMALSGADQIRQLLHTIEEQTKGLYPAVRNKPKTPAQKTVTPTDNDVKNSELQRVVRTFVPKHTY